MTDSIDATRIDCSTSLQKPLLHTLLIVEDKGPLLQRLVREMAARGLKVTTAVSVADGLAQIRSNAPAYALSEMRLNDGSGPDVI